MLTLLIPVVESDLPRLAILLQSLRHFIGGGDMKLLIMTPKNSLPLVRKNISEMGHLKIPLTFIADEDLYSFGDDIPGWSRQQVLKLLVSKIIDTDFYLILDCDNFATRPFSYQSLIQNRKAMIDIQNEPSSFQNLEATSKFLDVLPTSDMMKVTPAILSTDIVKKLLERRSIKDICEAIKTKKATEYSLYYLFAVNSGELWKRHFKGKLISEPCVWYPEKCFEWEPSQVFNSSGYFCVYQSNFNMPAEIVFDQIRDYIGLPRETSTPRISCLMVTKDRLNLVKTAVECFQRQTYPNKELVIVCDSPDGVKEYIEEINDRRIVLQQLRPKKRTLGDLRNFSIDCSSGELITQWDDDDWYHPSRLSVQYQHLKTKNADACLLSQWLMVWPEAGKFSISRSRHDGWEGTMLAKKNIVPRYSNLRKFEDTEMMKRLFETAKVVILDDPHYYFLYLYLVHGRNTWDEEHFKQMFRSGSSISDWLQISDESLPEKLSELVGMRYQKSQSSSNLWFWLPLIFMVVIIVGLALTLR